MTDLNDIAREAILIISDEWIKQGHDLTGKFRDSMTYDTTEDTINIYDTTERGYGAILNKGVPADRIPFNPGSGANTSKYIQGLVRYAKLRMGASDKQALGIAFAIAHKHIKEGMPTESSKQYSSTGKRIEFVEDSIQVIDKMIEEKIGELIAWP